MTEVRTDEVVVHEVARRLRIRCTELKFSMGTADEVVEAAIRAVRACFKEDPRLKAIASGRAPNEVGVVACVEDAVARQCREEKCSDGVEARIVSAARRGVAAAFEQGFRGVLVENGGRVQTSPDVERDREWCKALLVLDVRDMARVLGELAKARG